MPRTEHRWLLVAGWSVAVVVAALQAWGGFHRPYLDRLSDLQVYLGSVANLWHGDSLYDYAAAATGAPFTYPPFAGLVLSPLAFVPFTAVAIAWSLATFLVVAAMAFAVARRADIPAVPRPLLAVVVAVALFASAPVSSNFRFGQISVFLVAAVLADALCLVPPRFRGVATGIAGAIKLTPMIFVPYYWFSGQRRTAVTSVLAFGACTGLAWLVLPHESVRFWFTEIWNVNRVGNIATGGNQSLNGALLRWGQPDSVRTVVVAIAGLAVVVVAMARAVRAFRNDRPLAAAVMVGAAGLVLSPVSWTHHQVWLVLAALLSISSRTRTDLVWALVVLAVMLLPITSLGDFPGGFVLGEARLWLAIAVAAIVPFAAVRRAAPGPLPPVTERTAAPDG